MHSVIRPSSLFAHRWVRRLAWTVLAVLSTWLLAWSIVPPVLEHQLVHRASAELGRSLRVGRIEFKPWTLELTVHDLSMAERDGSAAQLAVKRIHVDAELESLWRLAPVVQSLEVDGPVLQLRRAADGRYDIDDILHRFAGKPSNDAASAAADEPVRFAVFNVMVRDGSFDVDDRAAGRSHSLRGLNLDLPFLSNLPSRRDVTVTPSLAFSLNGAAFASQAASTPFAPSRKSEARLRIQSMDLEPYLPYLPAGLPLRLRKGMLDADLQLQFVQAQRTQFVIDGELQLSGVDLADGAGEPLLTLGQLSVGIDALRPLDKQVQIGTVALQSPQLLARRDAAGRLNLALATAGGVRVDPAAATAEAASEEPAWTASMQHLAVRDGTVSWHDAAVAPQAQLRLRDLTVDVDDLVWPMERAAQFKGAMLLQSLADRAQDRAGAAPAGDGSTTARLAFDGRATDREAALALTVAEAPLRLAAPYLAQFIEPQLHGQLDASMELRWGERGLQVAVPSLTLDRLALVRSGAAAPQELAQVERIAVSSAAVDLDRRTLQLERLEIRQPRLAVTRAADQRWMFESWLKPAVTAGEPKAQAAAGAGGAPWTGAVAQARVIDGTVRFEDAAHARPVQLALSGLQLDLQGVSLDGKEPIRTHLSARVGSGQRQPGTIDYRGSLQRQPLQTRGRLSMERWPVHALEPYFGDSLNVDILRADAGFKGDIAFVATAQGPELRVRGDTVLEDVRANSRAAADGQVALERELLNWQSLGMRGIELAIAPGQPMRLAVRETSLSDFYARVIVHETGRVNLQGLVRGDAPAAPADAPAAGAVPVVATAGGTAAVATPARSLPAAAPQVQIGPISLVNGTVYFSDRFVKPNYSANLSELTGRLSAFSSASAREQATLAELELRGRAEGTASLEILGQLNPLADPLVLDIKGAVRDLELPALSPYAIKYAGHGIERGKLSVDVAYRVAPDGQLTASNQVVLNQLAFGDKVDGAPNSLPVKLAVALLADRNGVIDIDLPISGSLNDPQFQLGSVIFKVIVNLIGKALTAPFSLLASAFGGDGNALSQIAFAPGSAQLQPQARSALDKVAQALTQRPALRMTVVGTANLEAEREAFKRVRLQALLQAEKRRAQVAAGQAPAAADDATADETATEREERLRQLFARSEITRPRDLAGKPRELSTADMEALLLANMTVDEEAMRDLALRRGVAVKDYLASRQLPLERLFLGATRLPDADAAWSPRAELKLDTN